MISTEILNFKPKSYFIGTSRCARKKRLLVPCQKRRVRVIEFIVFADHSMWFLICKLQDRQYKALKAHILQTTPKEEQKSTIRKLKEEKRRKMALLGDTYEQTITEMLQKQSVRKSMVINSW